MTRAKKPVPRLAGTPTQKERVSEVLLRHTNQIIAEWLGRVKKNKELTRIKLSDAERMGYLPKLIDDLIDRLRVDTAHGEEADSICSAAAVAHGKMRKKQGYSAAMLVHDSRILQVSLFSTLHKHCSVLEFNLLLPDIMTIADEVDSQLTQAIDSYMGVLRKPAAA